MFSFIKCQSFVTSGGMKKKIKSTKNRLELMFSTQFYEFKIYFLGTFEPRTTDSLTMMDVTLLVITHTVRRYLCVNIADKISLLLLLL